MALVPGTDLTPDGKAVTVRVGAELLGTPEAGLWCPTCLLPSGLRQPFVLMIAGQPACVTEVAFCAQCDRDLEGGVDGSGGGASPGRKP